MTQRQMAAKLDVSLGTVNSLIAECEEEGLLDSGRVTKEGKAELEKHKVDNAVIFAAGFGSRFVPLTWDTPKGLLSVFGERMVERQIRQLHEVGITDITVMVGYMKEKFEYLKKKYNVKLRENPEYDCKNTLSTLHWAKDLFENHNTYLLYSDNYLRDNMFHTYEPDAWYSTCFIEGKTSEWPFIFNKKKLITNILEGGEDAWVMYGPVYFTREFSAKFLPVIEKYYFSQATENDYLEQVMLDWLHSSDRIVKLNAKDFPDFYANLQPDGQVTELDSLEQMQQFDDYYKGAEINHALEIICETFKVKTTDIKNIKDTKVGLTNHSFTFTINDKPYLCRVPWDINSGLINRVNEHENIEAVRPLDINEHVLYYDEETGYKISEYYTNAVNADINSDDDIRRCFGIIHKLHNSGIKVNHDFSYRYFFEFCEKDCMGVTPISLEDYPKYRAYAAELLEKLEAMNRPKVLCHFDTNPANWLFLNNHEDLRLIDWEYGGMADHLVDVVGMCNYAMLDKKSTDHITDLYFEGIGRKATKEERGIIYAGIAIIGLAWAVWGVKACKIGGHYEDYTSGMYKLMKDYYKEAVKCLQ